VAYENIGDNAESVAAANAAVTLDSAIRTYRAVEKAYPNQWDSLATIDNGSAVTFMATPTRSLIGVWDISTDASDAVATKLGKALVNVGIEELQFINSASTATPSVVPGLAHNESNNAAAQEYEIEDDGTPAFIPVVPNAVCTALGGAAAIGYPDTAFDGPAVIDNQLQNSIADILEGDECHVVVALGFGSDSASSTSFSNVGISQSPTFIHTDASSALAINPQTQYARFIGLFHIAEYDEVAGEWEVRDKARLLAVVSPNGKKIDELVADMQPAN